MRPAPGYALKSGDKRKQPAGTGAGARCVSAYFHFHSPLALALQNHFVVLILSEKSPASDTSVVIWAPLARASGYVLMQTNVFCGK